LVPDNSRTMKINIKNSLFFIFPLILISCGTQSYVLEVYSPPKLELPPGINGVLVFNRFVPAQGEYDRVQWGAYESVDTTMLQVADSCAQSFGIMLNSFPRFKTRMPEGVRMFKHNNTELPEPLPWEGILKIADKYFAQAIAIMETFEIEESEVITKSVNGVYTASVSYVITNGWRIYQPERRRVLDETVYKLPHAISASGSTKELAVSMLPDKKDRLFMAAKFAGEEYARLINPELIEVKRRLYIKGHEIIEEAAVFVEQENWRKAQSKWEYNAYRGESDELKAMCCFNMAVLSEKEGIINKALGYARKAQKLMPAKVHIELINELTIRLFELEEKYKTGEVIKNW